MLVAQGGGKMVSPNFKIKSFTHSPYQLDKSTHIINISMSCIDLIFCTNQSVISNHGVDVSIFDKCHHNIIYGKINIRVPLPPTYVREVWDYEKANIEHIKKAISNFDWNKAFENLSVDEKVDFLNKTLFSEI